MKPEELRPALMRWSEKGWDGGIQDLADLPVTAIIPSLLSEAHQLKLEALDADLASLRNEDGSVDRKEWYDGYGLGRSCPREIYPKMMADMLDCAEPVSFLPLFQIGVVDGIRSTLVRQKAWEIIKELELAPPPAGRIRPESWAWWSRSGAP